MGFFLKKTLTKKDLIKEIFQGIFASSVLLVFRLLYIEMCKNDYIFTVKTCKTIFLALAKTCNLFKMNSAKMCNLY